MGTQSALLKGSHTRAHTAKHGPSLPRPQHGLVLPAISLLFHRAFIYIHFPVLCKPSPSAEEKKSAKMPPQLCPQPFLIPIFNFSHKWPTFAFTSESGYTLGFRRKIAHKGTHGETGGVLGGGWYHYPRSVPHVSETLRGRVSERRTLPLLGLGHGCSQRTQRAFGTAMRLCASLFRRRRGPAGLRDLFRFCRNCGLYALRSGPFRVCEARGGITTISALYALLKRRTAACQNGSFAVF